MILETCEDVGCDIIGSQEVERNGQGVFTAAGYVVFCTGADGGKYEKKRSHGVGLAVRESNVAGMEATSRLSASVLDWWRFAYNSKGNLTVCISL